MTAARINKIQHLWLILAFGAVVWWVGYGSHLLTGPSYDIAEIDIAEARELINAGALVIDARSEGAYDGRHIPGALLVPLTILRAGIPDDLLLYKDKEIVVYCSKGLQVGPEATHILNQAGFSHAVNLKSGIEGWADAGQPVQHK